MEKIENKKNVITELQDFMKKYDAKIDGVIFVFSTKKNTGGGICPPDNEGTKLRLLSEASFQIEKHKLVMKKMAAEAIGTTVSYKTLDEEKSSYFG